VDPGWLDSLPTCKHAVINLAGLPLEPVAENLALRVMVKVLRAILEPDPATAFADGLRALTDLENAPDFHTFLRVCLTYLTEAGNTLDRETLYTILDSVKPGHVKEAAMSIADQLRQEGATLGMRKGRQEGRQEGERLVLQRQLTRKFGELDYHTLEKIRHATEQDLELWAERILDAKSLEGVLQA